VCPSANSRSQSGIITIPVHRLREELSNVFGEHANVANVLIAGTCTLPSLTRSVPSIEPPQTTHDTQHNKHEWKEAVINTEPRHVRSPGGRRWKPSPSALHYRTAPENRAIDEAAQIHDMVTYLVRRSTFHPRGFFYYAWVIPFGIFVLIFVLAYLQFLAHLPTKTRWLFITAGALYAGGALGMEMVAGFYRSLYWEKDALYVMQTIVEEFLEMTGIVVFVYALHT